MATEAQIAANRRNALKSTGPRTPEGKAKASRNAFKHGLASISPHAFLAVEDKSAFERLLAGYVRTYLPQHADEVDLLTDAVYCKWRQQRIWNVETQLIEMTIALEQHDLQRKLPKANAAAHVANATTRISDQSHLNRRYEAQLHRQYVRNLKLLRELQAERIEMESTLEDLDPQPSPTQTSPDQKGEEIHTNPDRKEGDVAKLSNSQPGATQPTPSTPSPATPPKAA